MMCGLSKRCAAMLAFGAGLALLGAPALAKHVEKFTVEVFLPGITECGNVDLDEEEVDGDWVDAKVQLNTKTDKVQVNAKGVVENASGKSVNFKKVPGPQLGYGPSVSINYSVDKKGKANLSAKGDADDFLD